MEAQLTEAINDGCMIGGGATYRCMINGWATNECVINGGATRIKLRQGQIELEIRNNEVMGIGYETGIDLKNTKRD